MGPLRNLEDVLEFNFKKYTEKRGTLTPITFEEDLPFEVKRTFHAWNVPDKFVRGEHAHYYGEQVYVAVRGKIEVIIDDGNDTRTVMLDSPEKAVYVPPTLWSSEIYYDDAILFVFCSNEYKPEDYVTDYELYKEYRKHRI